jgi:hypothetical protein
MKKILIISLFGLFVAHESSAMFARAGRLGKAAIEKAAFWSGVAALYFGPKELGKYIDAQYEKDLKVSDFSWQGKDYDASREWAQAVVQDTRDWRAKYRSEDQAATVRFIQDGTIQEGALDVCFDEDGNRLSEKLKDEQSMANARSISLNKERDLSAVEKQRVADLLGKAGYNAHDIETIVSKMFIMKESSPAIAYSIGSVGIGIKEQFVRDLADPVSAQIVLHEVAHDRAALGHRLRRIGLRDDSPREERCVELTSMEQVARIFGPHALRDLQRNDLILIELGLLPDKKNNNSYKSALLDLVNAGYISNVRTVRNIIADGVEREQLQEAQELLEKIEKVEKAERTERV